MVACIAIPTSVAILLDSTSSTEILSWKKIFERVESSKMGTLEVPKLLEFLQRKVMKTSQTLQRRFITFNGHYE